MRRVAWVFGAGAGRGCGAGGDFVVRKNRRQKMKNFFHTTASDWTGIDDAAAPRNEVEMIPVSDMRALSPRFVGRGESRGEIPGWFEPPALKLLAKSVERAFLIRLVSIGFPAETLNRSGAK